MKQGCILAPALFLNFISIILFDVFTDFTQGLWIQRRPGLNLLNASQFKPIRKTRNVLVRELIFAQCIDFVVHIPSDVQEIITRFTKSEVIWAENKPRIYLSLPGSHNIQIDSQVLT